MFTLIKKALFSITGTLGMVAASACIASAAPSYRPLPSVVNPESDLVLPEDVYMIYNVRQYGAAGDGVTDDTQAIQAAIDACTGTGGTVLLDNGTDQFSGSLDGGSHFIYGIWCDRGGADNVGLFAQVEGAVISNLGVRTAENKGMVGGNNVGLIAGTGYAVIRNCCAIGDVTATAKNVGGIMGVSPNGNKDATVITDCYYLGEIAATDGAGGILGITQTSRQDIISNCYSVATINRDRRDGSAGGVVGSAKIMDTSVQSNPCIAISNTFALGEQVNGASNFWGTYIRRFAGSGNPDHDRCYTFSNNYALSTMLVNGESVNNDSDNYHARDIAPERALRASTYTDCGWNFTDAATYSTNASSNDATWSMGNGNYQLPVLANLSLSYQPTIHPDHLPDVLTGIDDVTTDGGESTPEYYSLQGLKVVHPSSGHVYIERSGSAVRKVLWP